MKIIEEHGKKGLATIYIAETESGRRIECVESVEPPYPIEEKWVLIVSSLYGCPVTCEMCDAGGSYQDRLTTEEILSQIDTIVDRHYPDHRIPAKKFKIQFSRMGEPAFNPNVLDALRALDARFDAPGLMPCISTVAPHGTSNFFEELLEIKEELYQGRFQLQFSIHSTDEKLRDRIIPIKKWNLQEIADYGRRFVKEFDRKVTLNFVLADGYTIEPTRLLEIFYPDLFFVKMTPLNPTFTAKANGLTSSLTSEELAGTSDPQIVHQLRDIGYDVLFSVGELDENAIGSNCGQYIKTFETHHEQGNKIEDSYHWIRR